MKGLKHILVLSFLFVFAESFSQSIQQLQKLQEISKDQASRFLQKKEEAIKKAKLMGIPVKWSSSDGKVTELMYFEGDKPFYYVTDNINAAKTVSTNAVQPNGSAGYSLTGTGENLAIWDEGPVRTTHQEFGTRVTIGDNSSAYSNHATHVAGTMVASGYISQAKGMSYAANLVSRDWNSDASEMADAAAGGLLESNHSYSFGTGWYKDENNNWTWAGSTWVSNIEDYSFGFYGGNAQNWDIISNNAPYYLIVKAAGNDRGEGPTGQTHEIDGGSDGYDCISYYGVSKNVLTVGSVEDITDGYSGSSGVMLASYSGCGPTDDGRIKPDIVANGQNLYSPIAFNGANSSNSTYDSKSGTSMAAPNISGSIGLLLQHQRNIYNNVVYRASTMKALLIHTADEAGVNAGPDYQFGWGLANFRKAAQLMQADGNDCINIREYNLNQGKSITIPIIKSTSQDLRVTICWNDPAGTPPAASLNPTTKMLVNDLDLRVEAGGTTFYPWVLNRNSPSSAATRGDNTTDNVEQVVVSSTYTGVFNIKISHKGTLLNTSQIVSVIISGNDLITSTKAINNYSTSGAAAFWAHDAVTSGTTTLNSGSNVTFASGNSILLQNGFKVNSGASFSATINNALTCTAGSFSLKSAKTLPDKFIYERNIASQTSDAIIPAKSIIHSSEISISPNPSNDVFNIQSQGLILRAEVIDLSGKIILIQSDLNENSTQINLSAHKKGVYLLKLTMEKETITKKIVLN